MPRCCHYYTGSVVPRCVCIIICAVSLSPFIFNEQWDCVAPLNRESISQHIKALFTASGCVDCAVKRLLMMRHGSPSPLPIPQKVGDGQSEVGRGKEGWRVWRRENTREPFSIHNTVSARQWGLTAGAEVSVGFINMRLICRYSAIVVCVCVLMYTCVYVSMHMYIGNYVTFWPMFEWKIGWMKVVQSIYFHRIK